MKKFLFSLMCFGLAAGLAQAQMNMSVSFKPLGVTAISGLSIKNGGQFVPLTLAAMSLPTAASSYSGPNPMVLYRSQPSPQGKSDMVPVGQVNFPSGTSNGAFLVVISGRQGGNATGIAVADSAKDFPSDSARIINATPYPFTVDVNDKKGLAFKGGEVRILPMGSPKQCDVHVFFSKEGTMMDRVSNVFPWGPGIRRTVIIVQTNADATASDPTKLPAADLFSYYDTANASAMAGATAAPTTGSKSGSGGGAGGGGGSGGGNSRNKNGGG